MTELPDLTDRAVEALCRHAASLAALLAGARRFPMRPIGREGEDVVRYEEEVRRRFEAGEDNLFRLCRDPALYLGDPRFAADAELHQFFIRNESRPREELLRMLGVELVIDLLEAGVLAEEDGRISSLFRLVPTLDSLIVTDAYSRAREAVYLSDDSLYLASRLGSVIAARSFDRVVDLGCGSGILGLSAARLIGLRGGLRAVDINPRALRFTAANARLAGVDCATEEAAFADLAAIGAWALVVANPPFVFMPAEDDRLHSQGGHLGLDFSLTIVSVLDELLDGKSEAVILCSSPVLEGQSRPAILDHLAPQNLDVLVETVGIHPPFARFAEFYAEAGVVELQQIVLRLRRGAGRIVHDPRPRDRSPYLFG